MTAVAQWLEFLFLPPGLLLPFSLLALLAYRRRRTLSLALLSTAILLTLVLAMPKTARWLIADLQTIQPIQLDELQPDKQSTAIVVLGGGRYPKAPEYQHEDQISPATLERLRYAAYLSKELGVSLVLSGGRRNADSTPEAVMMNKVLVNEYGVEPEFLEVRGTNTHEQAIEVQKLLDGSGINNVILVTHAWHMRRAMAEFRSVGLSVVAAPMGYMATAYPNQDMIPSAAAMSITARALHEIYAMIWHQLNHPASQTAAPRSTESEQSEPTPAQNNDD